ncbi:uncharacterized protein PAC_02801 [Phialocephala subalpina]|uniref:Uncharacterized protein n=1 Tax=Phialocephala subalpina TaxID=576137 RepID=A0A1L7WJG2_9HELO|nr:uncharacterized protein PAC_02801 [Phialocephala subalpina]
MVRHPVISIDVRPDQDALELPKAGGINHDPTVDAYLHWLSVAHVAAVETPVFRARHGFLLLAKVASDTSRLVCSGASGIDQGIRLEEGPEQVLLVLVDEEKAMHLGAEDSGHMVLETAEDKAKESGADEAATSRSDGEVEKKKEREVAGSTE